MKTIKTYSYKLSIKTKNNLSIDASLLTYIGWHFDGLIKDADRFLRFLKEHFGTYYAKLFPEYQNRFTINFIESLEIELHILEAIKINSISDRLVYDLVFEVFINQTKLPIPILETIVEELLEDFNDGFYLEYNVNKNCVCRIIEI